MVGCQNPTCLSGASICSCIRSILFLTDDKCDLHLQEHPIVDKLLHLDYVQSFGHGILDLVGIDHGFLGTVSFCISSSIGSPDNVLCLLWLFPISVAMKSLLLYDTLEVKHGTSKI